MTNYIEEMMKTAGVEPDKRFKECKENAKNRGLCTKYPCIECKSSVFYDKYPDFTPEKQLEIIKLLGTLGNICITKRIYNGKWCITMTKGIGETTNFSQALAQLTTELMKAGELDKGKVRKVLES